MVSNNPFIFYGWKSNRISPEIIRLKWIKEANNFIKLQEELNNTFMINANTFKTFLLFLLVLQTSNSKNIQFIKFILVHTCRMMERKNLHNCQPHKLYGIQCHPKNNSYKNVSLKNLVTSIDKRSRPASKWHIMYLSLSVFDT